MLLTYPNFEEIFDIYTDASHTQLGVVISQKGSPIAFYSRKLNSAQTRYTTTERELLAIVEMLKEFRNSALFVVRFVRLEPIFLIMQRSLLFGIRQSFSGLARKRIGAFGLTAQNKGPGGLDLVLVTRNQELFEQSLG